MQNSKSDHVIIFGNPRAGARSGSSIIGRTASHLVSAGFTVEVECDVSQLAATVARAQLSGHLRAVVAAGGDGTVQLALNTVPLLTPLTILPLGTENLLARYCGLTADPRKMAEVLRGNQVRLLDLVEARTEQGVTRFSLMLGCGFDAEVVHRLANTRTGNISHWSYAQPIWRAIREYPYPEMEIQVAGENQTVDSAGPQRLSAHWVFAFNVPAYGGRIPFAPQADPSDGLLDVCCFHGGSFVRGIFHLATIWTRTQGRWSGCYRFRTAKLRVMARQPVPIQLDGDPGGALPVDISVVPRSLQLIVP